MTKVKTKTTKVSPLKEVKTLMAQMLKLMEVKSQLEVKKEDEVIKVGLSSDQPAGLIGYHGETLNSMQLLVNLMLWRKTGDWQSVVLDVDGYREKRKDLLEQMARNVAQKVKFSGQAETLPPMSAFERRLVHLALSDDKEIDTISEGEEERRVVVRPKS